MGSAARNSGPGGQPRGPGAGRGAARQRLLGGGLVKPDVVFFGENVPAPRVERCYAAVDALAETGGVLLVAGSSLTVMSGFRFVRRAAKAEIPVVVVNRGETRGDDLATYKLDVGCSEFLEELAGQPTAQIPSR